MLLVWERIQFCSYSSMLTKWSYNQQSKIDIKLFYLNISFYITLHLIWHQLWWLTVGDLTKLFLIFEGRDSFKAEHEHRHRSRVRRRGRHGLDHDRRTGIRRTEVHGRHDVQSRISEEKISESEHRSRRRSRTGNHRCLCSGRSYSRK